MRVNNTRRNLARLLTVLLATCCLQEASANELYNFSRVPLKDTAFVRLPLGCVTADGWLKQHLILQMEGLTGHAEELYGDIGDAGWIGGNNDSWERGPYYAKGLIPLAYILDDAGLIKKSQKWIDVVLKSQKASGNVWPAGAAIVKRNGQENGGEDRYAANPLQRQVLEKKEVWQA